MRRHTASPNGRVERADPLTGACLQQRAKGVSPFFPCAQNNCAAGLATREEELQSIVQTINRHDTERVFFDLLWIGRDVFKTPWVKNIEMQMIV
jgi:hypothetical protein